VTISGVNWHFAIPCLYHTVSVTSEFYNTMWPLNVSVAYTPVDHTRLKVVTDLILDPYTLEIYFGSCIQKGYIPIAGCVTL
jgi:hypothetical protein